MDITYLLKKIDELKGSSIVGDVGYFGESYPLFKIIRGQGKNVLISGGVHGDEPAGVHAVISFFENYSKEYENEFRFTAFPCVNPWGFRHYTRGNATNFNINREFYKNTTSQENNLIMPQLEQYLFTMDFHETMTEWKRTGDEPEGKDATEFYLWELCPKKENRLGRKIIENIEKKNLPVCKMDMIYGDKNNNGVIWYPEDCGTNCYAQDYVFDSYLLKNHTSQAFTIETPRDEWSLDDRVDAHITSLKTVLDERR